jgi:hypothetical protein
VRGRVRVPGRPDGPPAQGARSGASTQQDVSATRAETVHQHVSATRAETVHQHVSATRAETAQQHVSGRLGGQRAPVPASALEDWRAVRGPVAARGGDRAVLLSADQVLRGPRTAVRTPGPPVRPMDVRRAHVHPAHVPRHQALVPVPPLRVRGPVRLARRARARSDPALRGPTADRPTGSAPVPEIRVRARVRPGRVGIRGDRARRARAGRRRLAHPVSHLRGGRRPANGRAKDLPDVIVQMGPSGRVPAKASGRRGGGVPPAARSGAASVMRGHLGAPRSGPGTQR